MAWFVSNTFNVFIVVFFPPRCKRNNSYHQKLYSYNLHKFIYSFKSIGWSLSFYPYFTWCLQSTLWCSTEINKTRKRFLRTTQSSNIALPTTHHILLIISQYFRSHKAEKEADDTVSMPEERVRQVSKRTPGGRRIKSLQLRNPSSIRCKDYTCFRLALYAKDYHMYSFCTEKGWLRDKMWHQSWKKEGKKCQKKKKKNYFKFSP